ncbi:Retrovirus-related Pol polyprotein from transposon 17.6, partial [Mucuna pruriens]
MCRGPTSSPEEEKDGGDRRVAMERETAKLKEAGFIGEIQPDKNVPPDEKKITFMAEEPNYSYKVMPFILKNARVIYQRLMDKVFVDHIGWNLKVYVDDMVVKSTSPEQHIQDLEEIFTQVKKYNMRLNSDKCVFEFLGFMLTHRRIEANPDKTQPLPVSHGIRARHQRSGGVGTGEAPRPLALHQQGLNTRGRPFMDIVRRWFIKFEGRWSRHHLGGTKRSTPKGYVVIATSNGSGAHKWYLLSERPPFPKILPQSHEHTAKVQHVEMKHIPRKDNTHVNMLLNCQLGFEHLVHGGAPRAYREGHGFDGDKKDS